MKKVLILFVIFIAYFLIWPVEIEPVAWKSTPPRKVDYKYSKLNILSQSTRIPLSIGLGPEDIDVDSQGNIYAGLKHGEILKVSPDGKTQKLWANTNGRPLGMHFDSNSNLIVADAIKGLLSINQEGKVIVLSTTAEGKPYKLTDDLDIALDGKIYFTDASFKYGTNKAINCFLESGANGRFLVYDPKTKEIKVLLKDLHFANGVAISEDQSFVLINESSRYRVIRYWISGEKAGTSEIFIDGLDGIPDGISRANDGNFWVAFVNKRSPILDKFSNSPLVRKIVARIPELIRPKPTNIAKVMKISNEGKILSVIFDDEAKQITNISSAQEHNGKLYLGSFKDTGFAILDLNL